MGTPSSGVNTFNVRPNFTLSDVMAAAVAEFPQSVGGPSESYCSSQKGQVPGIGPNCRKSPEDARYEVAQCRYNYIANWIASGLYTILTDCTLSGADGEQGWRLGLSYYQRNTNLTGGPFFKDMKTKCIAEPQPGYVDADLSYNQPWGYNGNNPFSIETDEIGLGGTEPPGGLACAVTRVIKYLKADTQYTGWKSACECKKCYFSYEFGSETQTTTTNTIDVSTSTTPINNIQQPTTSAYGIMPRLYGRYIVGGNVIWVGNKKSKAITYQKQNADGTFTTVNETQWTGDLLVGLSQSNIDAILRIWIGAALIYNATSSNGATNALSLGALANSSYNLQRLTFTNPKFTLIPGGATQLPPGVLVDAFGQEYAPAQRDLSCIWIQDIDLALLGGSLPDMHFDATNSLAPATASAAGYVTSDAGGIPDEIDADLRTGLLFAGNGTSVRTFDMLTLTEKFTLNASTIASYLLLNSGNLLAASGNVIGSPMNLVRDNVTVGGVNKASVAFIANDPLPMDFGVAQQTNGDFKIVKYDYVNDVASVVATKTAPAGFDTQANILAELNGLLYLFAFRMNSTTQTTLSIDRYLVRDINGVFVVPGSPTTFSVAAANWGGATSSVSIVQAFTDAYDNNFVVLINANGSPRAVKLDSTALTVNWATTSPHAYPSARMRRPLYPQPLHFYISSDGYLISLDLATGAFTTVFQLSAVPMPALGGAQYYDTTQRTITYVDGTGHLTRFHVGVINAQAGSLSAILDAILSDTKIPVNHYDTRLVDIDINGLLLDRSGGVGDILNNDILNLYSISISDDGDRLRFLAPDAYTSNTAISAADDVVVQSLFEDIEIKGNRVLGAIAQFNGIDDLGLFDETQELSLIEMSTSKHDIVLGDTGENLKTAFVSKIYDAPQNIRRALEQYLRETVLDRSAVIGTFMPKLLALTPNDRVTVNGSVYRLTTVTSGIGMDAPFVGVRHDQDALLVEASIGASASRSTLRAVIPAYDPPERPVVLYTNPLSNADAQACISQGQLAYTGIEAAKINLDKSIAFAVSIGIDGGVVNTQSHTKALHSGHTATVLDGDLLSCMRLDASSSLVITFDHSDTMSLLHDYGASPMDVLDNYPQNLILVGNEWVQAGNVGIIGNVATFTNLFRGARGTEMYIHGHAAKEKCYLYTADTFKTVSVDGSSTNFEVPGRAFYRNAHYAGVPNVSYWKTTDAGGARPFGPASLVVSSIPNPFEPSGRFAEASWVTRSSLMFNQMVNLADRPNEWGNVYQIYAILDWDGTRLTSSQLEAILYKQDQTVIDSLGVTELTPTGAALVDYTVGPRTILFIVVQLNGTIVGRPTLYGYSGA